MLLWIRQITTGAGFIICQSDVSKLRLVTPERIQGSLIRNDTLHGVWFLTVYLTDHVLMRISGQSSVLLTHEHLYWLILQIWPH